MDVFDIFFIMGESLIKLTYFLLEKIERKLEIALSNSL